STFSNTTILIFLFVLLLLVSAEPFIKIASLGPLDRLLKRDVISLFVSAALTIALTTFLAADAYVYSQIRIRIDSQLQTLSEEVRNNFNEDLTDLLRVLKNLSEKQVPGLSDATLVNLLDTPMPKGTLPREDTCNDPVADHVGSEALATYPALDDVR